MFDLKSKTLKRVFELSQDILSIHSLDGTWLEISSSCMNILGYSKSYLKGKSIYDFIHPDDITLAEEVAQKLINTLQPQTFSYRIRHSEGYYVWLKTTVHFEKRDGSPIAIVFSRDITSLKEAEQKSKEYDRKLEATIESRDKFISMLSHDIRSPLQAIMGLSQILSDDIDKISEKQKQYFARNINISAIRLNGLLNNMIDWSKSQNGVLTCYPSELKVKKVINSVLDLFKEQLQEKNISIKRCFNENERVFADEQMTLSIFRNLISNAIKFSNPNSSIEIKCQPKDERIYFEIIDHGIGMDQEIAKNLFCKTKKVRKGTKGEAGSGIGLTLCKEFIEQHNGSIHVNTSLGEGTTFSFELPWNVEILKTKIVDNSIKH